MKKKDSNVAREKIITAAREVFSEYSYHAATLRMIGKRGGFDHPLISYYFPSKAALFESVIGGICDEVLRANRAWYAAVRELSVKDALDRYLYFLIDFSRNNPRHFRILALNLAQALSFSDIPGYLMIKDFLNRHNSNFIEQMGLGDDLAETVMFTSAINVMVINYLGSSGVYSGMISSPGCGDDYFSWVKKSLLLLFEPWLRSLLKRRKN
ncbi:MAG TPA: TetR/AcrR family transcriptional regulator [Spirochaetota bacterium]|nr:TetR/AcrR family transcriptional regulator [Spirochaetota bacterium]HPI89963.1 TetR/AcrR family transcriptional regulator [Spirochaetota bacterium]HPR48437.1 TetR/AcrR family transcriptional regulator [Spirochaetota bacterium]